jgi:hypothetical protein
MGAFLKKYFLLISILFVVVLAISAWKFPSVAPVVGIIFLCFSLGIAISSIALKHRTAYREGKLTRFTFARNIFLDVFGILLAMALAALVAQCVSDLVAKQVVDKLLRFVAAVLVGLLVGIGVGLLVRQLWGHFVKTSPGG